MSHESPAPDDPRAGTPRPAEGPSPAPGPSREPSAPALAGCLVIVSAAGAVLLAAAVAASAAVVMVAIRQHGSTLEIQLAERRTAREREDLADRLLGQVALRAVEIRLSRGAYPDGLGEALPEDPWGTPLRYERQGPERAVLLSAGPDREFGSLDDRTHALD